MRTCEGPIDGRFYVVDEEKNIFLPSVTTILGHMTDKSFIKEWTAAIGAEKAKQISERAANRGTYMHTLLEKFLHSKFVLNDDDNLKYAIVEARLECPAFTDDEYVCGKNLFFNFYNSQFLKNVKEVLYQEVPVWSINSSFAGRLDLCILNVKDQIVMIDFKSSKKPKRVENILNYKMQVAAYSYGLWERYKIWPHHCEIWISCESGELQTFTLDQNEMKFYFEEFRKLSLKFKKLYL